MERKFDLIEQKGTNLKRIIALKDFSVADRRVQIDDIGGWVEGEENLSQEGNCWIFDEAVVKDNARVKDNAAIADNVKVFDNAIVQEEAWVFDNVLIFGDAVVGKTSTLYGNLWIHKEEDDISPLFAPFSDEGGHTF